MLRVSYLVKFLQELKPQSTPTRLTFYNFIKNLKDPEASLTPEIIDDFFLHAIDYPHWYSHRSQLGNEVELILERFNSYFQNQFPIDQVRFPQSLQIIEIEQNSDWQEVISEYLRRECSTHDKFRLLIDPAKRGIGLILRQDGSLEVRFFDRKMIVRQGLLEPLRKDLVLYYNSDLELSRDYVHKFDLAPQMTAQFEVSEEGITGSIVRGYFFQMLQNFEKANMTEVPKLFTQLKKVEQFFVDPKTDPFYRDLKSQLEKAISQLVVGDKEVRDWARFLSDRAEQAHREIYSTDKAMERLVDDLKIQLKNANL